MRREVIAVVEDNADNRLLLQALLEERYTLVEYGNGLDAMLGFTTIMPDLVLLDISLPEMDGPEVLGAIRADARLRGLPVVALTAHAMTGDRERFLQLGFDSYVAKPIIDEQELLQTIEALLRRREDTRERCIETGQQVPGREGLLHEDRR
jgi:two-component system, cell cycle response regulator DivK